MISRVPCTAILVAISLTLAGCGKVPPTARATKAEWTAGSGTAASGKGLDVSFLEPAELDGVGATFIEHIMKLWTERFLEKTGGKVKINYQANGSGAGIASMIKKEVAFVCSDVPLNAKQLAEANQKGGAVAHLPLVIGAVVPMYNLPGVEQPIKFTGPILAEIFTGKIRKWNDPKLTALNPNENLPDLSIQPVYRAEPSGTSFIFSDYLSKVDPEFKQTVGTSTNPKWPNDIGIGQQKSDGVAGHIARTPGAVGYIELTFALEDKKAQFGSVRNKAGKDILADIESITAAAEANLGENQTQEPYSLHDLTYNLTNAGGEKSYPIAGISYGVVYQNLEGQKTGGAKGKALVTFFQWMVSPEGQYLATKRNYAPLPASLREKALARLGTISIQ